MVEQFGREDIELERQRLGYSKQLTDEIKIQENLVKSLATAYDDAKKNVNDTK